MNRINLNIVVIIFVFILGSMFGWWMHSNDKILPNQASMESVEAEQQSIENTVVKLMAENIELKSKINDLSSNAQSKDSKPTNFEKNQIDSGLKEKLPLEIDEQETKKNSLAQIMKSRQRGKRLTRDLSTELTLFLKLDDIKSKELISILEAKTAREFDINNGIKIENSKKAEAGFHLEKFSQFEDLPIDQDKDKTLKDIQHKFEEYVSNLLTYEEINKFRDYEVSTMRKKSIFAHSLHESMLKQEIPNIDEYQLQQISRFFVDNKPQIGKIALGATLSPYTRRVQLISDDFDERLKEYLSQTLTEEQRENYHPSYSATNMY